MSAVVSCNLRCRRPRKIFSLAAPRRRRHFESPRVRAFFPPRCVGYPVTVHRAGNPYHRTVQIILNFRVQFFFFLPHRLGAVDPSSSVCTQTRRRTIATRSAGTCEKNCVRCVASPPDDDVTVYRTRHSGHGSAAVMNDSLAHAHGPSTMSKFLKLAHKFNSFYLNGTFSPRPRTARRHSGATWLPRGRRPPGSRRPFRPGTVCPSLFFRCRRLFCAPPARVFTNDPFFLLRTHAHIQVYRGENVARSSWTAFKWAWSGPPSRRN